MIIPRPPISKFLPFRDERGITGILAAIMMVSLIGMGAFAVDLGRAYMGNQELHNIADGAALAGTRALGQIYETLSITEQQAFVLTAQQQSTILATINDVAQKNYSGGSPIVINPNDVQIGQWIAGTFLPTTVRPTAISVVARRDTQANGPMTTYLANVLGVGAINLSRQATAALLPIATVPPGQANIPAGISKEWFENNACGDTIKFHPTGTLEGCAGWHTFLEQPASASRLNQILDDLAIDAYVTPEIIVGQTKFEFTGGTVSSAFKNLEDLYDAQKDAFGNWEVFLPVYDDDDCSNPNGAITIIGLAKVTITAVIGPPNKEIIGNVECEVLHVGRPGSAVGTGGAGFGVTGTIPVLVS